MAKGPEIPKTDPAEIEILIDRLKQNKLEQRDVELIERLLRTVMVLVNLLHWEPGLTNLSSCQSRFPRGHYLSTN
jgi:hypothetical protein